MAEESNNHLIYQHHSRPYKTHSYPCISGFTNSKITRVPVYDHMLQPARERPGTILLDIGCCCEADEQFLKLRDSIICSS